ncbi:PAS domain-containing sensor histidine kinase [Daejeonella lutea]|uniref:histidine kinase n=1 Tax=Daejeonella lutea TaxID=572036 RepID=A0A1T5B2J0_9SPHI|nr:PAS domain-containing sensor histidine kinase [Daejeonella lutea]SKB41466.1 PAS domain S-box-containing protein [Daejeonella lutea]
MSPENIYQNIVELSPFPVYVTTGEDMIITVANDATLKAWGRDKSVLGKKFSEALPELKDQPFAGLIQHVLRTGEVYHTENDRADLMVDGRLQTYYYKFTYQPMSDASGNISSVLCFASDVTELELARQEVARTNQRLYNMVRQAPVGICIVTGDDRIVEVANDSYLEIVGKQRSELESRSIWEGVPEAAESYRPVLDEVFRTGKPFYANEHPILLVRNGMEELVYVDFVYEPVKNTVGEVSSVMVVAIEITDKVLSRKAVEDSEQRALLAIEATDMGTFEVDLDTGILRTSERLDVIFGVEGSLSRKDFVDRIHPDDIEVRAEAYREMDRTGRLFYEARVVWPDGSVHWISVHGKVEKNGQGQGVRMLGTVLDITDYIHLQQQKDDFISVASHELKTPMTSVRASMQVVDRLLKSDPSSPRLSEFVDKVNSNLAKMQQLVESLLNVSKISSGQLALHKTDFVVAEMVEECCDHIRMAGEYELKTTGDTSLRVYADKHQIDQVLVNLVNNAVKYAPLSKIIEINISKPHENYIKVSVIDFGPGIPEAKIPHIFDRYYRADTSGIQYSGLGLGLYISADIIKRHGGDIGVVSKEGEGSEFWFTLPVG